MDIIIKIIQFFLCFTILVGIHELGHFLMARVFKIRVDKFYIFFDPWFSLFKFKRGDTEYGLGWLPLGGYCKIAGMIDESMDKEQMKLPPKPDEFRTKPAWQRFLVMIAGVVMNVLLAIFIYIGICYTWGDNYFSNEDARWGYTFNEAGRKLGFQDGDRIVSIDGEAVDNVNKIVNALIITEGERRVVVEREGRQVELTLPLGELIEMRQNKGYEDLLALRMPFLIDSAVYETASALRRGDEIVAIDDARGLEYSGYQQYLKTRAGGEVTLTVKREGDMLLELVVPVSDQGKLGVIARNPYTLRTQEYTFWQSIPAGIEKAGKVISSYWEQLKMIVQPKTKMYEELGGFIAIGSIFPGDWNWEDFWLKTAFLSIILAVMNILPIPGLDGGHAIFTFWEMVTGRKVSDKVLEGAQYVRSYWDMDNFYAFSGGAPEVYLTYARWLAKNAIAYAKITGKITVSGQRIQASDGGYIGTVTLTTDADLIRISKAAGSITGNSGGSDEAYYYVKSGDNIRILSDKSSFSVYMESIASSAEEAGFLVGIPSASIQKVLVPIEGTPYPLQSAVVTFELLYGTVFVTKQSMDGILLQGAVFELLDESGAVLAEAVTDAQGRAVFSGIAPGRYQVREKTAPQGYRLSVVSAQEIMVTAGADTACMFINERMMGIIRVIKTDSMTGKPLPGVTFTVTRLTAPASDDASDIGKVVATITTNADGIAQTEALPWGEYRIEEAEALDGYVDTDFVTIVQIK